MGKPLSPSRVAQQLEEDVAIKLRLSGVTYPDIAQQLSTQFNRQISRTEAEKIVKRAMDRTLVPQDVRKVRLMQNARIDMLLQTAMSKALRGDLSAIDRVVSLETLRAKLWGTFEKQSIHLEHSGEVIEHHKYDNLSDDERVDELGRLLGIARERQQLSNSGREAQALPAGSPVVDAEVVQINEDC